MSRRESSGNVPAKRPAHEQARAWQLSDFLQLPSIQALADQTLSETLNDADETILRQLAATTLVGATLNSRRVERGYLFVSESAERDKRERFTQDAIERGAHAVFVASAEGLERDSLALFEGLPFFMVGVVPVFVLPNMSVSALAKAFYPRHETSIRPDIYGVTGTNGKTSCAWLLADVAENLSIRSGLIGTLGYGSVRGTSEGRKTSSASALRATGYTTPDAIEMQKILAELSVGGCQLVAIEVSSHGLDQGRVDDVDIKTAIFTNLSHDHLDYHRDMDAYFAAKRKLFEKNSVEFAVINLDDHYAQAMIAALAPEVSYLTYSVSNEHADIHAKVVRYGLDGIQAEVATPYGPMRLEVGLVGDFNLGNLLAVMAAFLLNGYKVADLQAGLAGVSPPPGRMQIVDLSPQADQALPADVSVIVDFAHTPDALQKVLTTLRKHCKRKLWCVFGCGGDRDRDKRPQMAAIAESNSDVIVVTVDNSRNESKEQIIADICSGFSNPTAHEVVLNRKDAVRQAIMQAQSGDLILLAGKGHEEFILEADKKIPFSDLLVAEEALRARMEAAA